ncbi:NTPase [Candidatus Bathyarchaeota archaeon]|nr:MAG: NTPase [Candidatus Bathyarchaeota archaeon]
MMTRILILTGAPGVGKTTLLTKTVDALKTKGLRVGGMITREVREGNVRVGFEILDLTSNKHGWLAHVNGQGGPQVGKYHVNLNDLDNVGAVAIAQALEKCDVIAIDEIGPMELFSPKFKKVVAQALESKQLMLTVVHGKAKDPIVTQIKRRVDAEIFNVTFSNRENLTEQLARKVYDKI